ncbi:hypothetical protein MKW98_002104 [Papaver atlanticum]|uniref:Uncharacterized protein n=1 Tax=Papaver atlanticum TaxID=357466 RepID=A0AAD4X2S0_9MAGN|nr:hypothetical protein MKW98_002104 [Papaver atlanticum]
MGEITPNLDDGELWLPSDILPDEIFSNKFDPKFSTELNEFMEEEPTSLSHLSTYSLFEQNHINSKVPSMDLDRNSKQIKPQNQFCGMGKTQPEMGLGLYGETPVDYYLNALDNGGSGDSYFVSSPYQFHDRKLPLPIVGDILQARTMILQRQPNLQQYYAQNNFLPLQVNNNGSWNCGFNRGCSRGTGVFIPRTPTTVANPGKKQSFWKGEESIDTDKRLGDQVKRPNPPY